MRARLAALESRFSKDGLALSQGSFSKAASPEPSLASSTALHQSTPRSELRLEEIENADDGDNFPASMFLDIDRYTWSKARPPAPRRTIPPVSLPNLGFV
jgi:hypothetical protein